MCSSYSLEEKKIYGTITAVHTGGCAVVWDDGTKCNISKIHLRKEAKSAVDEPEAENQNNEEPPTNAQPEQLVDHIADENNQPDEHQEQPS